MPEEVPDQHTNINALTHFVPHFLREEDLPLHTKLHDHLDAIFRSENRSRGIFARQQDRACAR